MNRISTTLKMKKRSYNDLFFIAMITLPFLGLLGITSYLVRVVTLQGTYGSIGGVVPIVAANVEDPAFHNVKEVPKELIDGRTVTIAITEDALFFGELKNFSSNLNDPSKRFRISHVDGSPQVGLLITQIESWLKSRRVNENIPRDQMLVLLPTKKLPMPILLQIMQALKQTNQFPNIVLGTGIT